MSDIRTLMPPHHKHCDALFSDAEEAAQRADWVACEHSCQAFAEDLEAHFRAEEELLFPAFEEASGMRQGPTQVMRMEHGQMRELLAQMQTAVKACDADAFAGAAETLLILMQQHNMKEENILYPMCDQVLAGQMEHLGSELQARLGAEKCRTSH